MRGFIVSTGLVLALTLAGPSRGADDNLAGNGNRLADPLLGADGKITALLRGCHVYLADWADPDVRFEEGVCVGIVKGLWAGALGQAILARKDDPDLFCIPHKTTYDQVVRVVIKYIDRHPEEKHSGFEFLALSAMQQAWPCKH